MGGGAAPSGAARASVKIGAPVQVGLFGPNRVKVTVPVGVGAGAGAPVTVAVSVIGLPMVTVGVAWVAIVATAWVTTDDSLASLQARGDRAVVGVAAVGRDPPVRAGSRRRERSRGRRRRSDQPASGRLTLVKIGAPAQVALSGPKAVKVTVPVGAGAGAGDAGDGGGVGDRAAEVTVGVAWVAMRGHRLG